MFIEGQKVKRVVGEDGCFPAVGSIAFVGESINEHLMTLMGCGGHSYNPNHFIAEGELAQPVAPEVHELIQALHVIDKWNRLKPTSQMLSIEAHCAQDGGSTFIVGNAFDTNNAQELFNHLVHEVSRDDLKVLASQFNSMVDKL